MTDSKSSSLVMQRYILEHHHTSKKSKGYFRLLNKIRLYKCCRNLILPLAKYQGNLKLILLCSTATLNSLLIKTVK